MKHTICLELHIFTFIANCNNFPLIGFLLKLYFYYNWLSITPTIIASLKNIKLLHLFRNVVKSKWILRITQKKLPSRIASFAFLEIGEMNVWKSLSKGFPAIGEIKTNLLFYLVLFKEGVVFCYNLISIFNRHVSLLSDMV